MVNGLCKFNLDYSPDDWFDPEKFDEVRKVCDVCPLKAACLQGAIDNGEKFGVWGGTTPFERGHIHGEDGVSPYEPL